MIAKICSRLPEYQNLQECPGRLKSLTFYQVYLSQAIYFRMAASPSQLSKGSSVWSPEEDRLLLDLVGSSSYPNWTEIAESFPNKTTNQACLRWHTLVNPEVLKGRWLDEEDRRIRQWVQANGPTRWVDLAKTIPGRAGHECRGRWFDTLDPNVRRSRWKPEEDYMIRAGQAVWGNDWTRISLLLPGRNSTAVRNRWTALELENQRMLSAPPRVSGNALGALADSSEHAKVRRRRPADLSVSSAESPVPGSNESTGFDRSHPLQGPEGCLPDAGIDSDEISLPDSNESTGFERSDPLQEPERRLPDVSVDAAEVGLPDLNASTELKRSHPVQEPQRWLSDTEIDADEFWLPDLNASTELTRSDPLQDPERR
jgi:hypothetical protein